MAVPVETLGGADRFMDEMALADAESVPGIHLDREDPDQGFDQPGPQRDPRSSGHTAPTTECCHGVVDADRLLPHHHPSQGPLAWLTVRLMGACDELTADPGNVLRMDEVEAGIGPKPARQPEPTTRFRQALGEIARGERAGAVDTPTEHQGWENRNDLGGQWMLLKLFQAACFGLDVFGAVGQSLRQWPQVTIQDAGG